MSNTTQVELVEVLRGEVISMNVLSGVDCFVGDASGAEISLPMLWSFAWFFILLSRNSKHLSLIALRKLVDRFCFFGHLDIFL